MELHHFFAPTDDFTDEQTLAHRAAVTSQYPSLPQSAGRAYANALTYLGTAPPPLSSPPSAAKPPEARHRPVRGGRIIVKTVRRPEIDVHKLIRILEQLRRDDDEDRAD